MIVVDCNVIAYLYIEGEFSEQAKQVWQSDSDWAAPILWRSEFRNILATTMRFRDMPFEDALLIMNSAEMQMQKREYEVGSTLVLRLAAESGCSAYACEYMALAMSLGVQFVTVDRQLLAQFPEITRSLASFAESA